MSVDLRRLRGVVAVLLLALAAVALDVAASTRWIGWDPLLAALDPANTDPLTVIVREIRLPRALAAALAGAGLAVAGLLMQTHFRNPLAGPDVLGVSSGASLGVALLMFALPTLNLVSPGRLPRLGIASAGILGAAITFAVVAGVARRVGEAAVLLVLGLLIGFAVGGVVSVLVQFSDPARVQAYLSWTYGSFATVTLSEIPPFALLVLGIVGCAWAMARALNALLLGESYAASVGVHVRAVRRMILALTSVAAGVITGLCGPVAFVGVATPHLCRAALGTSDHRLLVPAVAAAGATMAALSDWLAYSAAGSGAVLPVNAVTSVLGAPVVAWVVLRRLR